VGWNKPKLLSTKEKGANLENGSANKKLGNITTKVPPGGENILKKVTWNPNSNMSLPKASQSVSTMKQHLNQTGF
jgi:peptidoglycan hydrolase-like protein with peptidoglycan-binding domain